MDIEDERSFTLGRGFRKRGGLYRLLRPTVQKQPDGTVAVGMAIEPR